MKLAELGSAATLFITGGAICWGLALNPKEGPRSISEAIKQKYPQVTTTREGVHPRSTIPRVEIPYVFSTKERRRLQEGVAKIKDEYMDEVREKFPFFVLGMGVGMSSCVPFLSSYRKRRTT